MSEMIPGGWSPWIWAINKTEGRIFDEVMEQIIGVEYKPVAIASQVVSGTNYAYLCEATIMNEAQTKYVAIVYILAPLKTKPFLRNIRPVQPYPNGGPGGWSSWDFPSGRTPAKVFQDVTDGLVGVGYENYGNSTQVVAGSNYAYLVKGTPVYPDAESFAAVMQVNAPLPDQGKPTIQHIIDITP
jgi:hypothetical protein